jgi:carbon-monoxide dehydrogenase medium subunit
LSALKDFDYAAASSVEEAVSLLAARGKRARILAGGTDIIVQLRERLRDADLVVDIKKIPELMRYEFDPAGGLRLGAAVPCYRLVDDPALVAAYPGLIDAARIIGGWQIQSRASIGGNLCNSSPAADSIPPLLARGATCHVVGPDGPRTVPAALFCTAPGKNVLAQGELLVMLEFPPPTPGSADAYLRFIPRNEMDIAVAGAGSWVQLDDSGERVRQARIGLAAVGPTPLLAEEAAAWLEGKPANEESFAAAGELAKTIARPISDMRGTVEFRKQLVGVLVRRTLTIAAARARETSPG